MNNVPRLSSKLVFSKDKFEEFVRENFSEEEFELEMKDSKGWLEKCEGLTPEEMNALGYDYDNNWLVEKNDQ